MQSAARAKVPACRHVDLQRNDRRFRKDSLSAVMRAFMSEHEIARGTSMLLRRYCRPIESCTDVFLWRPGLRAILSKAVLPHLKQASSWRIAERAVMGRQCTPGSARDQRCRKKDGRESFEEQALTAQE
jgi:hypothetical protein